MRGIGVLAIGLVCATAGLGQISIEHFAKIDTHVYAGSKPHTDQDFEYLQSLHVRYIANARFLPFLSRAERKKAKRYGMTLLSFEMSGSPVPPSEKHVDRILKTLHDPRYQPVYLHCVLGRDRTGLLEALYRMKYLGVSREDAWQDMLDGGFHTWWFVRGLRVYFDRH